MWMKLARVLNDHFPVNGFIMTGASLAGYRQVSKKMRVDTLKGLGARTKAKE
jgi:hypothetical protein